MTNPALFGFLEGIFFHGSKHRLQRCTFPRSYVYIKLWFSFHLVFGYHVAVVTPVPQGLCESRYQRSTKGA